MHRVFLLEFVNADQFPGRVDANLPLVRGYLDELQVPSIWLRLGIATTNLMQHQRDQVTLEDEEIAKVLEAVRTFAPTLLLTTDPLFAPQEAQLLAAAPGATIHDVRRVPFTGLPGLRPFGGSADLDRPGFVPRYDWQPANAGAERHDVDNIYVVTEDRCGYFHGLSRNAWYEGLDDARVEGHHGCTFCGNWLFPEAGGEGGGLRPATLRPTPASRIAKQIEAIAEERRRSGRLPNALLLTAVSASSTLQQCLDSLRAAGLARQIQVLCAARADQVPRIARLLRDAVARDPEAGFRVGVYACGIESFDPDRLALFNKGTTTLDGLRAVRLLRELASELGEHFWYTGVSFVLLTPWTTPESLHLDVGLVRFLGLTRKVAGNLFQARLRLHPELPITALAERDGLLAAAEPDPLLPMNRRKMFHDEEAWRFADARMRPLSRLMLRLDLLQTGLADELAADIERTLLAVLPTWNIGQDAELQDFVLCLIEVVQADVAVLEEATLLQRAARRWREKREVLAAPPQAQRFRFGEQLLDLPALLAQVLPVVATGLKPVLSIEGVLPAEVELAQAELARRGLCHAFTPELGTLDVARTAEEVKLIAALRLTHEPARRAQALGRLHGYPACCAEAFAQQTRHAPLAWEAQPLPVPVLGFVPCQPDCHHAQQHLQALWQALDLQQLASEIQVVTLDSHSPDECIALPGATVDGDTVRYDPKTLANLPGPLREQLRRADRVQALPGQLRLWQGERCLDVRTATHALWSPQHTWHAAEWHELALAAARDPQQVGQRRTVPQLSLLELNLGLKKVLRLEARPAMPEDPQPLGGDPGRMVWQPRDVKDGREWFGGYDRAEVAQALAFTAALEQAKGKAQAAELMQKCGALLGYPACCTAAFAARPHAQVDSYTWVHLANRLAAPGPVPWELNAAAQFFLDYVPCGLDCQATVERCKKIVQEYRRIGEEHLDDYIGALRHPWLFGLDAESDVLELVTEWDGQGELLHYQPGIRTGDGPLLNLAAQCDALRVTEDGLTVLRQGKELATLTGHAFVWWHERAVQVRYLQQLVQERFALAPQPQQQEAKVDPRLAGWPRVLQRQALAAGFKLTAVDTTRPERMLLAVQLADGTPLRLLLTDRTLAPNSYLVAGPFALMYPPDAPIDTKAKDRVVRLIAASLEQFISAPRR